MTLFTIGIGFALYFFVRCILYGFYTVDQNERGAEL